MKKCIKISIVGAEHINRVFQELKQSLDREAFEGYAYICDVDAIEAVFYGDKEDVDNAVEVVRDVIMQEQLRGDASIDIRVEPHAHNEDYRGVFRFIKSG